MSDTDDEGVEQQPTDVSEYKEFGPSERELLEKPDLDDMSLEELQVEYRTLDQFELHAMEHPDYWERYPDIWKELKERTDVQQPECPDCGARDWGQTPGDPIHCTCGKEGVRDKELREEIYEAWDRIIGVLDEEVSADV